MKNIQMTFLKVFLFSIEGIIYIEEVNAHGYAIGSFLNDKITTIVDHKWL